MGGSAFLLAPGDLLFIARANVEQQWNHTATLLCTLHNMLSKERLTIEHFHPMHAIKAKKKKKVTLEDFRLLLKGKVDGKRK
jgi:hypothetical protein